MSRKHEYMLHTWGGFYNKEHADKHGLSGGYFWFDTESEREEYLDYLRRKEVELSAHALAFDMSDGTNVRARTVASLTLEYYNTVYQIQYDFGYAYPCESAEFMFTEGNYSCDCNLASFIRERYPEFPVLECGDEIETLELRIDELYED
jgi:hypothetical protein